MTQSNPRRNPPTWSRRGKQARFSYLARDPDGRLVRKWHPEVAALKAPLPKALHGMVKP